MVECLQQSKNCSVIKFGLGDKDKFYIEREREREHQCSVQGPLEFWNGGVGHIYQLYVFMFSNICFA